MDDLLTYLDDMPRVREDFVHHGDGWKLVKRVFRDGGWWSSAPRTGPIHVGLAIDMFRKRGYTFVIDRIQEIHVPFKRWTDTLEDALGHRVNANLYVTPNDGNRNQAFEAHFDYMDGYVLQLAGCKYWRIARDPSTRMPIADTVFKVPSDAMEDAPRELEVRPGALLYLPRGFAHEAAVNCTQVKGLQRAGEDTVSIHVTLGLECGGDSTVEVILHHLVDQLFGREGGGGAEVDITLHGGAQQPGIVTPATAATAARDLLHLLVHAAALVDPASALPRAWDREAGLDGVVLRTGVAVTAFAASSGAYATLPTLTAGAVAHMIAFQDAAFTPTLSAKVIDELRETLASKNVAYVHRFLTPTVAHAVDALMDDPALSMTLYAMWGQLVAALRLDDGPTHLCAAWQRMTDVLRVQREARLAA